MSTQSLKENNNKKAWDEIFSFKNEDEEIEYEAQMLMFTFLGEIEKYQDIKDVNRKSLSERIKTSASYITQLFRGNRPLNFLTIAKMQKALKIKFEIKAINNCVYNEVIIPSPLYITKNIDVTEAKFEPSETAMSIYNNNYKQGLSA